MMTNHGRKQWKDLSPNQRAAVVLGGIVQISLLIAALIDIRKRSPDEITGGDKRIWIVLAFINFFGPIAYFVFGRKRSEITSG